MGHVTLKCKQYFKILLASLTKSRGWSSVVGVETSNGLDGHEFEYRLGQDTSLFQDRTDLLWGPSISCFMGTGFLSRR
jgi:hypothetical protein